jgi:hypothetical protein
MQRRQVHSKISLEVPSSYLTEVTGVESITFRIGFQTEINGLAAAMVFFESYELLQDWHRYNFLPLLGVRYRFSFLRLSLTPILASDTR